MQQASKYKKYKKAAQIIFWAFSLFFFIFWFKSVSPLEPVFKAFLKSLVLNICFAIAVYINLELLIPLFLKKKQYIFYTFWLTVSLSGMALVTDLIFIYPLNNLFDTGNKFNGFDATVFSSFFFANLFFVVVSSFAKFASEWLELQEISLRYNKVEKEKLEAELSTLKAQINPHFLFNSLNNIYSLALVNSKDTPRVILMLSDLMRHVLYESRENFISLRKEINFVNNFIELQKLRINKNVDIRFNIVGEVSDKPIAPLLFEPFIDNAFKHGLRSPADSPFIHISFKIEAEQLFFEVRNNFGEYSNTTKDKAHGVGLENVKRRLEFLYPRKDYKLVVNKSEGVFSVFFHLKLRSI